MNRTRFATLALALLASSSLSAPAFADPDCRHVRSRVTIVAAAENHCNSPISLCASTTFRGQLRGTSNFVGTQSLITDDTPVSGSIILTGTNTIQLRDGVLVTKDTIVLSTLPTGEFAEVDTIVPTESTGAYAGATGNLTATGTFINGVGEGELEGVICLP